MGNTSPPTVSASPGKPGTGPPPRNSRKSLPPGTGSRLRRASPPRRKQLDVSQRNSLHDLAADVLELGQILREQEEPSCVDAYQEAMELYQRIGDRKGEAITAFNLGVPMRTSPTCTT